MKVSMSTKLINNELLKDSKMLKMSKKEQTE